MIYFYLFCLLISQISDSLSSQEKLFNATLLSNKTLKPSLNAEIPIISEGGIIPNSTILKDHNTNIINLEKELEKDEGKSVVPRKGVDYNKDDKVTEKESEIVKPNSTTINKATTQSVKIISTKTTKSEILNTKHKPLILSYEALSQMDKDNDVVINENEPNIKIHSLKASGNPGMIMPIVITILVVPMFAVVGYMAIKRGKEAWKNRHYKRMDFLLDGMYND